ncbi:MAG TPA: endonuclease/exonuclease/phosphatase family protein [Rariglobus sp.]|jgi:endonuclease/exonuclease/phosphatase family metal-dependent hydrolase|nr:endonuclease/exonuclease/phosphatase family protein [Rariglobus sp.]
MKARQLGLLCFLWVVAVGGIFAETLTVATYNVENYTLADRMVHGVFRKDYPKPEVEKKALRTVIHGLGADVLALQEIGSEAFLRELQRDLKSEGLDYAYAEVLNAVDADRHVAVLSRRPFLSVVRHTDLPFKYFDGVEKVKRGLLELHLATEGGDVTFFVVHLKSRYTDRKDDPESALQRAGEAVAVRDQVLKEFPDPTKGVFVIMGDFNDSRASRPVRAMLDRGKTKIAEWLPAADSRGEVWTHFYKRDDSYARVDHMLVSPGLLPMVRGQSGKIGDSLETVKASDHRPVVAVLDLHK